MTQTLSDEAAEALAREQPGRRGPDPWRNREDVDATSVGDWVRSRSANLVARLETIVDREIDRQNPERLGTLLVLLETVGLDVSRVERIMTAPATSEEVAR